MTDDFHRHWVVRDGFALLEPPDGSTPPALFLASGMNWVALAPPVNREEFPAFGKFLRDMAEAANDLRLMCHPFGEWGRHVFANVTRRPNEG